VRVGAPAVPAAGGAAAAALRASLVAKGAGRRRK